MDQNNLSLEEINPKEAELRQLAADYGTLAINGIDDKEGYDRAHAARMVLKGKRVEVEKAGKALREKTTAFNKSVIAREKELIGIIEPLEERLHKMELEIDEAIDMEKRRVLLPDRRQKAIDIECVISDADLLKMEPETFAAWYNQNHALFLERKAAALKADEERNAKEKVESERRALWPSRLECLNATGCDCDHAKLEQAMMGYSTEQFDQFLKDHAATWEEIKRGRAEAEERGRKKAEDEAAAAAKKKADDDAKAAADAKAKEEREQAELEGKKKYQAFLKKNDVTEATIASGEHKLVKTDTGIQLYKLVDTIKV